MPAAHAARYVAQFGHNLCAGLDATVQYAIAGRWPETLAATASIHHGILQLHQRAVLDALDAGADWWAIGQAVGQHPQAAFDNYANLAGNTRSPAQQRPKLAVLLTAGLTGTHHPCPEYGVDVDVLGFAPDPQVEKIRAAARLCGQHTWIRITAPAARRTGEPFAGLDLLRRWTSVLADDAELAALRQALPLRRGSGDGPACGRSATRPRSGDHRAAAGHVRRAARRGNGRGHISRLRQRSIPPGGRTADARDVSTRRPSLCCGCTSWRPSS
ncbi:hypothetical protein Vau01_123090 [Virgisporangium aurantiacum]|uniref:Uncharacterized protein n=1 Tax=Virgisporangium aurantiacum TaxID=175570 RepID=A0A8J3ZNC9_9ACTN|nr:hypothetical protein Vau01_123090 [Virgisporangium aurantiacum]